MFIRRSTFDALVKRIDALEAQTKSKYGEDELRFTVYEPLPEWARNPYSLYPLQLKSQIISVKNAIEKIMSHVGLEMKYVSGEPERVAVVEIVKTEKAKK